MIPEVRTQSSGCLLQLAPPGGGQRIETGVAVVLGRADARLHPAALLEPQQRRIDRPLVERQRRSRHLLDPLRDAVAVQRPERVERLQHEQIEGAAQDVRFLAAAHDTSLL
jgi:hypothetical protein